MSNPSSSLPRPGHAHAAGIAVTLTLLEEALKTVEEWAKGRNYRGVMYRERNTLSSAARRDLLSEIEKLRREIASAATTLHLSPETTDAAADIRARCGTMWEHIVELEGRHLKRYGELPDETARYMDTVSARLAAGLERLSALVSPQEQQSPKDGDV